MAKRIFIVMMEIDWEDYDDVAPDIILEDSGTLDSLKRGVYMEMIGELAEHKSTKEIKIKYCKDK